jgi:DNA mismatch repair protein MutS2
LNLDGSLTDDPKDGTVAIQIGSMRATLPLNQLRPLRSSEIKDEVRSGPVSARKTGASEIALRKAMQISPELMLRALRAEEAQMMLDKYLDDAYTAGLKQARIIHGKGTGALRRIVHEALNNHPAVEDYAIAAERDGGDGATVVKFRE